MTSYNESKHLLSGTNSFSEVNIAIDIIQSGKQSQLFLDAQFAGIESKLLISGSNALNELNTWMTAPASVSFPAPVARSKAQQSSFFPIIMRILAGEQIAGS